MKKILNWIDIYLAVLIGLLVVALAAAFVASNSRANRTYDIQVESVFISTDAETIERGRHLAASQGCVDCHGDDFSGGSVIDDPAVAVIYAPNLTPGQGGPADYSDEDWVRAIRAVANGEAIFSPAIAARMAEVFTKPPQDEREPQTPFPELTPREH